MTNTRENEHHEPSGTVDLSRLDAFLQHGFTVLTMNQHDPNPDMPFEAWAYRGPLDFDVATPLVFGLGMSGFDALNSLDNLLADHGEPRPAPDVAIRAPLLVDDRELATILAALRFHQVENLQGTGAIPGQAIRDIATDGGRVEYLGFKDVDRLCERLNLGAETSYCRQWRCADCQHVVETTGSRGKTDVAEQTEFWAEEAIAYLGLDRLNLKRPDMTLQRLIKKGSLRPTKISGRNVFKKDDLDRIREKGDQARRRGRPRKDAG